MGCEAKKLIKLNENLEFEEVGFLLETNCEKCDRIREELEKEDEWLGLRSSMLDNMHRKEEAKRLAQFESDFFNGVFTK